MIILSMLAGCKPSTFIISKNNMAYYFGMESKVLYRIVCESGDFKKVLRDANIRKEFKKDFYNYTCTENRSNESVISLYTILTPMEKKSLKRAFIKQGYRINAINC